MKSDKFQTRIYKMQYRILNQKRKSLFITRILFICFFAFSYLETVSVLNTVPRYKGKLFSLYNNISVKVIDLLSY